MPLYGLWYLDTVTQAKIKDSDREQVKLMCHHIGFWYRCEILMWIRAGYLKLLRLKGRVYGRRGLTQRLTPGYKMGRWPRVRVDMLLQHWASKPLTTFLLHITTKDTFFYARNGSRIQRRRVSAYLPCVYSRSCTGHSGVKSSQVQKALVRCGLVQSCSHSGKICG